MTWRAGVDPRDLDARANALVDAKQAVRAGAVLVSEPIYGRLKQAIVGR